MFNPTTPNDSDAVFELDNFQFDPDAPREKTIYHLRKAIIATCKKKGMPNKIAEDIASRNVEQVLDQLQNMKPESRSAIGATGTVIKGKPKTVEESV